MLKAFVHRANDCELETSDHADLSRWLRAAASAGESASHILLHVGFEAYSPDALMNLSRTRPAGTYATKIALELGQSHLRVIEWHEADALGLIQVREPLLVAVKPPQDAFLEKPRRGRPRKDAISAPARSIDSTSLSTMLTAAFKLLPARQLDVVRARWGMAGEIETLDGVGQRLGVTRARIGQIEISAANALMSLPEIRDFVARLANVERGCAVPVPVLDLPALDPWIDDVERPDFTAVVRELSDGTLDVIEVGGVRYLVPFNRSRWRLACAEAKTRTQAIMLDSIPLQDAIARLDILGPKFARLLWNASAARQSQVAEDGDGMDRLVAFGTGLQGKITAVLFEAEQPLHRDEVLRRVRQRLTRSTADNSIMGELTRTGLLFARGVYGSRRHIPFDDATLDEIVARAEFVVESDVDCKQWSQSDLCQAVVNAMPILADSMTPYMLTACLRQHGTRLGDLTRGVWSRPGTEDSPQRIRIREFVIQALERAGSPLDTEEIKKLLTEERGIEPLFQIQPKGRLIRLGRATWGLVDRDVPVPVSELEAYGTAIKAYLLRTGRGLHVSGIAAVLEGAGHKTGWVKDPEVFLSLAQRFGGLRVTINRHVLLPEWRDESGLALAREAS